MQTSISSPVSCYGIGVHSGDNINLTLKPAKPGTGIIFVRTDVKEGINFISAFYSNVKDTSMSTRIFNNHHVSVSTIEHLMAAIWGCGIDNLVIELDGPEVPIMDGSSKPFIFMIEYAGKKIQNAPKKRLKILKEVHVTDKDSTIYAAPSKSFNIDLTVDYASKVIGKQNFSISSNGTFKLQVGSARTFGFVHELEYLKSKGLARGASLENAIGIDQDKILNSEGLRFENEFVRHKLLDLVGDLYTTQSNIIGSFSAYKTSHALNNEFLRQLFSDQSAYQWI